MSDMPQAIALFQKAKNESARKRLNIKAAFFWCTSKKESLAVSRMALAMDEAGFDDEDFARPIRVNLPVVDDLPDEGVFSTAFCDRYQLGDDGMTFHLIPGAEPLARPGEKVVEGTDTIIVDGVDTATGEVVGGENDVKTNGEQSPYDRLKAFNALTFEQQVYGTWLFGQISSLDAEQKKEVSRLSMDTENTYAQNVNLAANNFHLRQLQNTIPEILAHLLEDTKAVWPVDGKAPRLESILAFFQEWLEESNKTVERTPREQLVEKWQKKFAQPTNRTPSGANAGGVNQTDRLTPLTVIGLEYEIALGLIARKHEFDIYQIPMTIEFIANDLMRKMDNKEFLATRELFVSMPGGLDFSRASNVATVKTTPEGLWKDPPRHREHLNRVMTETDHAHPDELIVDIACGRSSMPMPMAGVLETSTTENASNGGEKPEVEPPLDVQVQTSDRDEKQAGDALPAGEDVLQPGEGVDCACVETAVTSNAEILAAAAPHLATQDQADVNQISDSVSQNSDSVNQIEPETAETAPEVEQPWPTRFEPGRYENVPNDVYHAANGISSTMLKDARISLMYYYGRHVAKTIPRVQNDAMLRGTIIHSFVLEPEKFESEFAVPAEMPGHIVSTSTQLVAIIKEYNAGLPALMTPDELKAWIEQYNATLTQPLSLSAGADDTANLYMSLPSEFQRIPEGTKHTATTQKACIKEYNASLPPMLKMSGTRDQLLEQIATVDPEYADAERAKFVPYNISGPKEQLTEVVRAIRPDVVTAEDWHKQQEEVSQGKVMIALDMYEQAKRISAALQAHPSASRLLNHPDRQSEVSYFGFDEDTGLEIRVRPDLEIQLPHARLGGDLKTTSLGYVKQDDLKARLHREIISRDYHLSAAMYCDTANLDQFFWIFVNRDEGYHWIAIVEASQELLELGRKEYRLALRTINDCTMSGNWPAPITDDYTDELNEFDLRRLEMLSVE